MSDPKLQRADGCSVFFSLIIGIILVSAYFLFQLYFNDENKVESNNMVSDQRSKKIMEFKKDSKKFELNINNKVKVIELLCNSLPSELKETDNNSDHSGETLCSKGLQDKNKKLFAPQIKLFLE